MPQEYQRRQQSSCRALQKSLSKQVEKSAHENVQGDIRDVKGSRIQPGKLRIETKGEDGERPI
jgi:hypothetical protein